jgi:hypothetical protein
MKFKYIIFLFSVLLVPILFSFPKVFALDPLNKVCDNGKAAQSEFCKDNERAQGDTASDNVAIRTIGTASNIIAVLAGLMAVIMIMMGGFSYITSGGSSEKLTTARNRIIYSVVGLLVVVLAWTIINFIIERVIKT